MSESSCSSKKNKKKRTPLTDEEKIRRGISKSLSWVLRHGLKTCGLETREDGYVKLKDLLACKHKRISGHLKSATPDLIRHIVKICPKQRFRMEIFDKIEYNQSESRTFR